MVPVVLFLDVVCVVQYFHRAPNNGTVKKYIYVTIFKIERQSW